MRLILLGTADLIWEYLLPAFFPGKENYQGLSQRRIWVLIRTVDSVAVCWFLIRELPNDNDFLWPGGEMSPKKEHSCHREDLRLRPGVYICWLFWSNFLAPGEHISSRSYGWGWLISAVFAHPVSFPLSLQLITPRFLKKIAVRQRRVSHLKGMGLKLLRGWDPSSTSALIFRNRDFEIEARTQEHRAKSSREGGKEGEREISIFIWISWSSGT